MSTSEDAWLALVGLGLAPGDITQNGLEAARSAEHVFLETYTARPPEPLEAIEERTGSIIAPADRALVEEGTRLLEAAKDGGCCLLVTGDPFSATTHTALRLQAREENIPVRACFAASILTAAAGMLGLSHYKFGRTTTLVTPRDDYFPKSPYRVIQENLERGLHTLVLLDIHDDGSTMRSHQAAGLLLDLEEDLQEGVLDEETPCCVVARAGHEDAMAWHGPLGAIKRLDAGGPMHTLVVPGEVSVVEEEALSAFTRPVESPGSS